MAIVLLPFLCIFGGFIQIYLKEYINVFFHLVFGTYTTKKCISEDFEMKNERVENL